VLNDMATTTGSRTEARSATVALVAVTAIWDATFVGVR
jgi:hypothetical protein